MTTEELMEMADRYAQAMAQYELAPTAPGLQLVMLRRSELEEALSLTSKFGGL